MVVRTLSIMWLTVLALSRNLLRLNGDLIILSLMLRLLVTRRRRQTGQSWLDGTLIICVGILNRCRILGSWL